VPPSSARKEALPTVTTGPVPGPSLPFPSLDYKEGKRRLIESQGRKGKAREGLLLPLHSGKSLPLSREAVPARGRPPLTGTGE